MTSFPSPDSPSGLICNVTSWLVATSSRVSIGFVIVGTVKHMKSIGRSRRTPWRTSLKAKGHRICAIHCKQQTDWHKLCLSFNCKLLKNSQSNLNIMLRKWILQWPEIKLMLKMGNWVKIRENEVSRCGFCTACTFLMYRSARSYNQQMNVAKITKTVEEMPKKHPNL